MTPEPRKPRFTNIPVLTQLSRTFAWLAAAGFLASLIWLPIAPIEWLIFLPGVLIATHMLQRATAWQQAQWVKETSAISTVTFDVLRFRSLIATDDGYSRRSPVKVTLQNKQSLELPWLRFTTLGPSELVSYETRVIGGKREFRNIA